MSKGKESKPSARSKDGELRVLISKATQLSIHMDALEVVLSYGTDRMREFKKRHNHLLAEIQKRGKQNAARGKKLRS